MTDEPPILGVFVGGRSVRMGGRPKGRLPAPDTGEPIVERLVRVGREAGLAPVLVGDAAPYADLAPGVLRLADDPAGVGPLGGLAALLRHAGARPAVAVACDMPHVTAAVLRRVAEASATEPVVAARRGPDAPWEPMLARYDSARVLPALEAALAAGERSFQALLGSLPVHALPTDAAIEAALADWDVPDDLPGSAG